MFKIKRSLAGATLAAAGTLLLLAPAAGQAAVGFGALRTANDPTASGCGMAASCTVVSYANPANPDGNPYSGGSPVDGVVTSFSIRAYAVGSAGQVTFRIADVSRPNPADTTAAIADVTATGPTVTIPVDDDGADVPLRSFPARVAIRRGQHLAIDAPGTVNAIYASDGSPFSYMFAPRLVDGEAPRASTAVAEELLVSAIVEPDADRDGFGDETQDRCSTDASTHGACSDATSRTLKLTGLRVSGGLVRYRLSTKARVSLQFAKGVGCASSGTVRCGRFVRLGDAYATNGKAGVNTAPLPRPHGRLMAPGVYRVNVTARAHGKVVRASVRFRVLRSGHTR